MEGPTIREVRKNFMEDMENRELEPGAAGVRAYTALRWLKKEGAERTDYGQLAHDVLTLGFGIPEDELENLDCDILPRQGHKGETNSPSRGSRTRYNRDSGDTTY